MKITHKISLLAFIVLGVTIAAHASNCEDENESLKPGNRHVTNVPAYEDCRRTYLPKPMHYIGSDLERDVALYRPENNDTITQRFWKIVETYRYTPTK